LEYLPTNKKAYVALSDICLTDEKKIIKSGPNPKFLHFSKPEPTPAIYRGQSMFELNQQGFCIWGPLFHGVLTF
jgi:hypothetical protein